MSDSISTNDDPCCPHELSTKSTESTRLSPSSTQADARSMGTMPLTRKPKYTTPRPARSPQTHSKANLRFGLPASWDDMVALGLDPLTGEVTD